MGLKFPTSVCDVVFWYEITTLASTKGVTEGKEKQESEGEEEEEDRQKTAEGEEETQGRLHIHAGNWGQGLSTLIPLLLETPRG